MSLSQLEQESKFKKLLSEYWSSKGITQIKIPQIGGQELNLFKLYKAVCKKGGGQAVSHNKLWKQIVDEFGLPSTCTSASFTLKNHYQKYLLGYEQRFFFGKDDNADLPELVAGRQRKPMKQGDNMMLSNRFGNYRLEGEMPQSTLSSELKKYYEKSDHSQHINFIKRTKMYAVMSQVKHMILAFLSPSPNEITYAINMLLLFSMNTEAPFLFNQYPNVLESVAHFLERIYPAKNILALEYIRTVTIAIRNLLINHKNLQPFLESPLLQIFSVMFQGRRDPETTRTVSDIFSSLSRLGWDCKELFQMIQTYLDKDNYQDLETGIDLLRSLVQQKEEQCQSILCLKLDFFSRLLIINSINFCLYDIKILKDSGKMLKALEVYGKIVCFDVQQQWDILKASSAVMSDRKQYFSITYQIFMGKFERSLALISFNDDSLSPITSSILFYLSGRVNQSQSIKDQDKEKVLYKIRKNMDRDRMSSPSQSDDQDMEEEMEEQEQDDGENNQYKGLPNKKMHIDQLNPGYDNEKQLISESESYPQVNDQINDQIDD